MGLLMPPLLLVEEAGFHPHREGNGFPMHAWRFIFVSTLFESCEPYSWYFHGRLCRFATQIIDVFFLFAQWWTVIHNPRFVKIHTRHSELFNDGTCTGGWFWTHSRNFSLMTTVNYIVNVCRLWSSGSSPALWLSFEGHPGATTFPPSSTLDRSPDPSDGPSASRRHFCSAHDHGQLRSDHQSFRRPNCTLSRLRAEEYDWPVTQSIATPEPSSRTIPTLDRTLVAR